MSRISKHRMWMQVANVISQRATCSRRKVGAVIVDKDGYIMSTGYNGPSIGVEHCIDKPCPGAGFTSGLGLGTCIAIHAEQNALIQCKDHMKAHSIYITCSPCDHCLKMIMNTGIVSIYYGEAYFTDKVRYRETKSKWEQSRPGRTIERIE